MWNGGVLENLAPFYKKERKDEKTKNQHFDCSIVDACRVVVVNVVERSEAVDRGVSKSTIGNCALEYLRTKVIQIVLGRIEDADCEKGCH